MSAIVTTEKHLPCSWAIPWEEGMKIQPGFFYTGLPNELYHGGPGISKSGLDLIRRSPAHYIFQKKYPRPSTPTLIFGSALHSLVLEPDQFDKEFIAEPDNAPRRPTERQINAKNPSAETLKSVEFWNKFDNDAAGKIIISSKPDYAKGPVWGASDWDKLRRMRDSVFDHPIASVLLDSGIPELTGYWKDAHPRTDTQRLCKIRMDWYNDAHNLIVDLKTTMDASYTKFSRSIIDFRYYVQDGFYREGMRQLSKPVNDFVFIAIEKDPPYAVACYRIDKSDLKMRDFIDNEWQRDVRTYHECQTKDDWPCYVPMRPMDLPRYVTDNIRVY